MKISKSAFLLFSFVISSLMMACQSEESLKSKSKTSDESPTPQAATLELPPDLQERTYTNNDDVRWQLLTPSVTSSTPVTTFLAEQQLESVVTQIYTWNTDTSTWKRYPELSTSPFEDLSSIEPNTAYWFQVNAPIQFADSDTIQRQFTFKNGWNLVGFSSGNAPVDVEAFFSDGENGSILGSISSVWLWKGNRWQVWASVNRQRALEESDFEELAAVTPGQGFWVNYNGGNTTEFTYTPSIQSTKAFFAEVRNLGLSVGDLSEELDASGSIDQYADIAQDMENELDNFSDLKTASARLAAVLQHSSSDVTQNALHNLVPPDDFQDLAIDVEGTAMFLDVDYTLSSINNLTVDWTLKTSSGQTSGYDSGSYGVSGITPKIKGAVHFNASILDYRITVESINYDLGDFRLQDSTAAAHDSDLKFELTNFTLMTTVNDESYQATWETATLLAHYKSELVNAAEEITDQDTYVSSFVLQGFLQTPRAKLSGQFDFSNSSHSVFGKVPTLDESGVNAYTLNNRTFSLFDHITFDGSFQYLPSQETIHIGLQLSLEPNQSAYLPVDHDVELAMDDSNFVIVSCDGSIYTLYQSGDSVSCENGAVLLTRDLSKEGKPQIRVQTYETSDNYLKGSVSLTGDVDSFLSAQFQGYDFNATMQRTAYQAGTVSLSLDATATSFAFTAPGALDPQTEKIVTTDDVSVSYRSPTLGFEATISATATAGEIHFQNDWLKVDLSDPNLENHETRDVGTIKNLLDTPIATVEYNKDLGLRAKYTDDSFETLVAIPPRLIEGTLAIEGVDEVWENRYTRYRVSGQFTDGKTRHVNAKWDVDNKSVASIQYGGLWSHDIEADTNVTITAKYKGENASKTIMVRPLVLVGYEIDLPEAL